MQTDSLRVVLPSSYQLRFDSMDTTKLSSKGQVVIPKALRDALHWEPGLELTWVTTDDGLMLKASAPFPPTELSDVAGMLKKKAQPRSDAEIAAALNSDIRRTWRDRR